jgi:hypothetical protein
MVNISRSDFPEKMGIFQAPDHAKEENLEKITVFLASA